MKEAIPEANTSDVIPYEGVDRVIDATALPFADGALRLICMMNVFHHIPDVVAFLREAQRCLAPGGRVLIADQHVGVISRFVLKHLHHEGFAPDAVSWEFESAGPLSSANGALAWMVFQRDQMHTEACFPRLRVIRYQPHAPLRYWLIGGLKRWNLIPASLYGLARRFDDVLLGMSSQLGSFVFIELVKE